MKKAQAANEAAIIIGLMTMFLIIFIAVLADQLLIAVDERAFGLAQNLGESINLEVLRASKAEEGYSRTFETPPTIRGRRYTVQLSEAKSSDNQINISQIIITVNLSGGGRNVSKPLPESVSGMIENGTKHCIQKKDDKITVKKLTPPDTCDQL